MRILLCTGLCVLLPHAHAENPPIFQAEPLIVTATRVPTPSTDLLQSTTSLERGPLDTSPRLDALHALDGTAGFESVQTGGLGTLGGIFLRGTDSDQTLVLIDGIRVNAPTDGGVPLNNVPLDAIERVELVRGNVSSLYGSQAIGGVIQLFTQSERASEGANVSAALGSLHTGKTAARVSGGNETTRFGFGASYLTTDGFSAVRQREIPSFTTRVEDLDDDAYRNASVHANVSHAWSANHELRASVLHTQARTEFDGSFENRTRSELTVFALNSVDALADNWTSRLTIGQAGNIARNSLDAQATSRFATKNRQVTWQHELRLTPGQTALAGLEWLRQSVDSTTAYDQVTRRVTSPFAGYYLKLGTFSAQLSARHDRYSDVASASTGRLSLGYEVSPGLHLRAGVASAFKAPTFDDLYFPGFGNPSLKPERARSIEAGVRYQLGGQGYIDASASSNRLRELITFDGQLLKPLNVERAKIDSVELTIAREMLGLQVSASATWQDARNDTTGARLLRRARWFGAVKAVAPMARGSVHLRLRTSGAREDNSFDFTRRVSLGGYALVDVWADYALSKDTRLELSLGNVLDKDYEQAHGYNVAPRTLLLQVSRRLP
jgi:vitamin B12 transporter